MQIIHLSVLTATSLALITDRGETFNLKIFHCGEIKIDCKSGQHDVRLSNVLNFCWQLLGSLLALGLEVLATEHDKMQVATGVAHRGFLESALPFRWTVFF